MASESKSFPSTVLSRTEAVSPATAWLQIAVAYFFIMAAVWTPDGPLKLAWMSLAAVCILLFTASGRYSIRELGIGMPPAAGTVRILTAGVVMAAAVPLIAMLLHTNLGPVRPLSWHGAWQYFIWALLQQFILQSFFYLRFESLLGSRRAVVITAAVFAAAHIPSPVLTCATFLGGLFFCEMFRRYRNICPLGAVHALLGVMVATSFSDAILHHMHVGIGYLSFHP
ncbi:MAG: CPBP family intramembrane metalloprotease [Acidobacteriia bacterium]|nr:CPBP family intramembrane metalloprotease [Terriglobia bacterium]